ncbi:hypothetical protein PO124_20535 [Bacillus licheniformis]|nr:hypothetical protein [Bacillus licheniformis]
MSGRIKRFRKGNRQGHIKQLRTIRDEVLSKLKRKELSSLYYKAAPFISAKCSLTNR